jgi:hypothetical protein
MVEDHSPHSEPQSDNGSESDSEVGSYERTDERTDGEAPSVSPSGNSPERVRPRGEDDIPTIGDVIAAGFMRTWERHPVVRAGERDLIPAHVRAAVWYRDSGLCSMCPGLEYQPEGPLHLDHITPWSAGGPDTTDNLRLLCEPHNLERSNFVDHAGPKLPATWWCHRCYDLDKHEWLYYEDGHVVCPIHRYGPEGQQCRVVRAYQRQKLTGEPIDWWHMREPLTRFHLVAYCAHCSKVGETSITL